jgi:hypothetical protein
LSLGLLSDVAENQFNETLVQNRKPIARMLIEDNIIDANTLTKMLNEFLNSQKEAVPVLPDPMSDSLSGSSKRYLLHLFESKGQLVIDELLESAKFDPLAHQKLQLSMRSWIGLFRLLDLTVAEYLAQNCLRSLMLSPAAYSFFAEHISLCWDLLQSILTEGNEIAWWKSNTEKVRASLAARNAKSDQAA